MYDDDDDDDVGGGGGGGGVYMQNTNGPRDRTTGYIRRRRGRLRDDNPRQGPGRSSSVLYDGRRRHNITIDTIHRLSYIHTTYSITYPIASYSRITRTARRRCYYLLIFQFARAPMYIAIYSVQRSTSAVYTCTYKKSPEKEKVRARGRECLCAAPPPSPHQRETLHEYNDEHPRPRTLGSVSSPHCNAFATTGIGTLSVCVWRTFHRIRCTIINRRSTSI